MRCAMAVMAKVPRAGAVKTRLVPPLTAVEAVALSGTFLGDITANIAQAGVMAPIAGYVAYAPAGAEAGFAGLLAPGTGLVLADGMLTDGAESAVSGIGRSLLARDAGIAGHRGGLCVPGQWRQPDLADRVPCGGGRGSAAARRADGVGAGGGWRPLPNGLQHRCPACSPTSRGAPRWSPSRLWHGRGNWGWRS